VHRTSSLPTAHPSFSQNTEDCLILPVGMMPGSPFLENREALLHGAPQRCSDMPVDRGTSYAHCCRIEFMHVWGNSTCAWNSASTSSWGSHDFSDYQAHRLHGSLHSKPRSRPFSSAKDHGVHGAMQINPWCRLTHNARGCISRQQY